MSRAMAEPRLPPLHTRMRKRRAQLGLTGTDVAQRAGISTSYVSLIENGAKVPDEEVAAGLARALADDEALYRAWARAARIGVHDIALLNQLEAIARTPAYVELVESGQELPRLSAHGDEGPVAGSETDLARRLREVASKLTPSRAEAAASAEPPHGVVAVPVLAEGADPAELERVRSRHRLLLDRRLLGGHDPRQLFACEVPASATGHLRGIAAPGDRVVFRRGGAIAPDRVCAVRTDRGLVLSRVLVQDRSLLLLPGEGETAFESVALGDGREAADAVAGTHVLLIRN
jgi:transcriptional regulator with XRE-family HTH domain